MGDYYWYGCQGVRDPIKSAQYYGDAALKEEPQVTLCCQLHRQHSSPTGAV